MDGVRVYELRMQRYAPQLLPEIEDIARRDGQVPDFLLDITLKDSISIEGDFIQRKQINHK